VSAEQNPLWTIPPSPELIALLDAAEAPVSLLERAKAWKAKNEARDMLVDMLYDLAREVVRLREELG
jgi:hypothetical protein